MWDGLFTLLLLCLIMAGASFLAGILPLSLTLTSRQLRLITALGTGVLVGTSLVVIIPEGVETLYSASESGHGHAVRSTGLEMRREAMPDFFPGSMKHDTWRARNAEVTPAHIRNTRAETDVTDLMHTTSTDQTSATTSNEDDDHDSPPSTPPTHDPHAWIGLSLITGFTLMYLIDTLPRTLKSQSQQPQSFHISLNSISLTNRRTSSLPASDTQPFDTPHHHHGSTSRPSSTTVGLVIHAISDGIALGATSSSSNTTGTRKLSLIIFLALLLHKAPAAFGLTTTLLKQNLSKRAARAHLIVFSLAAPVGALLTWSAANLLGFSTLLGNGSTEFATGVLLLFSGGTFLYVAVHTMQDHGDHGGDGGQVETNGYAGVPGDDIYAGNGSQAGPPKKEEGSLGDTLVCVLGMLLPLLLQVGGHGH